MELNPHNWLAYVLLSQALIETGNFDEGIRAVETAGVLSGQGQLARGMLGYCYARANRVDEAKQILGELHERAQKVRVPALAFAFIYLGLGEFDKGLDCLENAVVDEPYSAIMSLGYGMFEAVRSHPRYKALLRKINLEL